VQNFGVVAARRHALDHGAADETRAADEEDSHGPRLRWPV
jgi:hypothetical protein